MTVSPGPAPNGTAVVACRADAANPMRARDVGAGAATMRRGVPSAAAGASSEVAEGVGVGVGVDVTVGVALGGTGVKVAVGVGEK